MPQKGPLLDAAQRAGMKAKAEEQLESARVCLAAGRHNSAASRGYYALYAGMAWFVECEEAHWADNRDDDKGPHQLMRDLFVSEYRQQRGLNAAEATGLRNSINEVKGYRTSADYWWEGVGFAEADLVVRRVTQHLTVMGVIAAPTPKSPPPSPPGAKAADKAGA